MTQQTEDQLLVLAEAKREIIDETVRRRKKLSKEDVEGLFRRFNDLCKREEMMLQEVRKEMTNV